MRSIFAVRKQPGWTILQEKISPTIIGWAWRGRKIRRISNTLGIICINWKTLQGFISRNIRKAFFWENIRNFLILELESSISWNIRNFFPGGFLCFFGLRLRKLHFLKCKKLFRASVSSWNVKRFFLGFRFLKCKKLQVKLSFKKI